MKKESGRGKGRSILDRRGEGVESKWCSNRGKEEGKCEVGFETKVRMGFKKDNKGLPFLESKYMDTSITTSLDYDIQVIVNVAIRPLDNSPPPSRIILPLLPYIVYTLYELWMIMSPPQSSCDFPNQ